MHKVIILGFPLLFVLAHVGFAGPKRVKVFCEKVLDGDTVICNNKRVRLVGIDAPEISQKSRDGRAIGRESESFLKNLIQGKELFLEYSSRDQYGRILGKLYLGGVDINLKMLEFGFAVSFMAGKVERILEYQAKLKRRGIFSSDGFYAPSYYRKLNRKISKEF